MPIYEYRCPKCGAEFEKLARNSSEKAACEKCGAKNAEKKLSTFSAKVMHASRSCPSRNECPSATKHSCGSGCGCHH